MIIEIFLDAIIIGGELKNKISAFRYGRDPKTVNQPNKNNVYKIEDHDFKRLIHAIDNVAVLCSQSEADFVSGNLFLKIVDDKKGNIEKEGFLEKIT